MCTSREIIKYTKYKRFGSKTKITFQGEAPPEQKTSGEETNKQSKSFTTEAQSHGENKDRYLGAICNWYLVFVTCSRRCRIWQAS